MPITVAKAAPDGKRENIVTAALQAAKDAAGKPYTFGGKTLNGFDCSGFVAYVYKQVVPDYTYLDTGGIRNSGRFIETKTPGPGDVIFFPKGQNPYEVKKGNKREWPDHVGIVLDGNSWIGSQSSTGVAKVSFDNLWWSARSQLFFRYLGLSSD